MGAGEEKRLCDVQEGADRGWARVGSGGGEEFRFWTGFVGGAYKGLQTDWMWV